MIGLGVLVLVMVYSCLCVAGKCDEQMEQWRERMRKDERISKADEAKINCARD